MNPDFFQQLQEMQRRAADLQKNLAAMEVEGTAGAGMVRAVMNGLGELKSIFIDPSLMKPDEQRILEDLVVAACNDGRAKVEARRAQDTQFFSDILKGLGMGGS
jgi:nucleoid-associated protein EbfC